MYPKSSRKLKTTTTCIAATAAPTGGHNFQPDAWWGNPPSAHYKIYLEVNMFPVTALKAEAAVASAASSAQQSAITGDFILPSLRRKAIAFRSIFYTISPRYPFQYGSLPLCST
jgi:hypothetical protein